MKRWINTILDRPWVVIVLVLLITAFTGSFLTRLEFDASIEAMIPMDDPVLEEQRAVAEDFGSQELFLIAIQGENVFSPQTLKKIGDLTEQLEAVPGISMVQSPLNAQMVESSFFGIEIRPMTTEVPQTLDEIAAFKEDILNSPYVNRLITEDGGGAALLVDFADHNGSTNQVISRIQEIVDQFQGPEQIHMVGDSYVLHYTELAMKQDLRNLVPFVILIIALVLYVTFRSMLGVFIPLATVGASLIWTVGLMAWYGIPVSIISMVMPVILVTLGIASSIHILTKYQESLAQGVDKRDALVETFATITSPVMMAALTTAAGFASLITAFVHPIREFGVLTAIGVMLAMGLSLSLTPALLMLFKEPKPSKSSGEKQGFLTKLLSTLTSWAIASPKQVTVIVLLVTVLLGFGATFLTLESNIVNYFGKSSPVRKGAQVIEDVFGGSMQISVVVDTGEEDGIKDPAVLADIVAIQDYLNSWENINHATSIADVIRELNQALWDGDPEFYALPDTREGVAQQLLLFSMQGGEGLDALVSYDYSRALVTAQMKTLDAQMLGSVIDQVDHYLEEQYGSRRDLEVSLIGTPKVMLRLMNRYVQTQVSSLVTSSIAVGIIVSILMKSVALGLLSLVPLLLTVLINFGTMGYLGMPLDAVTSIIASLAIGIGVDYAIHYISRYRFELAQGHNQVTALQNTGVSAGRGIFFNAFALIIGFLVLVFSHFRAIAVFGFLISVTMVVSSLAALLVIPLLLQYFANRKIGRGSKMKKALSLFVTILVITSLGVVFAQDLTGQQILDDLGFSNVLSSSGTAELNLITENAKGAQRRSSLRVFRKSEGDLEKQFLEYLAPADVRGTKFLSINEKGQEDQMWLYMPALGRERRIAAHMTGDSFMGTDFTYDEIGGNIAYEDQYVAQRLADETEQGVSCYVLDLTAADDSVLYERVKMWVWQEQMVPVKVEFYQPATSLKKTLILSDYRQVEGEFIPHNVVMADNLKGTKTILEIVELSEADVDDEVFTVRNLRR